MLVGSIDLNKIDKNKIKTVDKDGNRFANGAKYYDIVVWVKDSEDQYGNIAGIQEGITKEERESGGKGVYIGNLREVRRNNTQPQTANAATRDEDDLPF